jgi:hypothetical protein
MTLTFYGTIAGDEVQNDIEPLILKVHQTLEPFKIATVHLATPLW